MTSTCVTIGCAVESRHQDKNTPSRTFCSSLCATSHKEMLSGQITSSDPLYRTIETYYASSYDEAKDYTSVEFQLVCKTLANLMRDHYRGEIRLALSPMSYTSVHAALVDSYKSNKTDRARLVKSIIGSFMNYVKTMRAAADVWRKIPLPESVTILLLSLFNWMTFEQGQAEIRRWMPENTSPNVILFRAVTKMSQRDPFVTMPKIDYSSTLVQSFPPASTPDQRQALVNQSGGVALSYHLYATRNFGPDTEVDYFYFLKKALDAGAQKVLVYHENELKLLDLAELEDNARNAIPYNPRYTTWKSSD